MRAKPRRDDRVNNRVCNVLDGAGPSRIGPWGGRLRRQFLPLWPATRQSAIAKFPSDTPGATAVLASAAELLPLQNPARLCGSCPAHRLIVCLLDVILESASFALVTEPSINLSSSVLERVVVREMCGITFCGLLCTAWYLTAELGVLEA